MILKTYRYYLVHICDVIINKNIAVYGV